VRCEPVPTEDPADEASEFDVACSFTTLEPEARNLLDAYVAWKLLRSARADEERASASPMAGRRTPGVRRGPRTTRAATGGRKPARKSAAGKHTPSGTSPGPARKGRRTSAAHTGRPTGRKTWSGKSSRTGAAARPKRNDRKPVGSGGRR
jgi:hypothetical protein